MTENELLETLSQNIKFYRKDKFTQETLAEKVGVSAHNINNIEGKRRFPRTENLIKIADALGVEVYQLFIPRLWDSVVSKFTPPLDALPSIYYLRASPNHNCNQRLYLKY